MADTKKKCADCTCCLVCSEDRCRLCRKESPKDTEWELGRGFTFGAYLEWKERRRMRRTLNLDLSECTDCESCLSLCPSVFRRNEQTGLIEIDDAVQFSEEELQQVMSMCPADCIQWEES
jgi:ferredoxin